MWWLGSSTFNLHVFPSCFSFQTFMTTQSIYCLCFNTWSFIWRIVNESMVTKSTIQTKNGRTTIGKMCYINLFNPFLWICSTFRYPFIPIWDNGHADSLKKWISNNQSSWFMKILNFVNWQFWFFKNWTISRGFHMEKAGFLGLVLKEKIGQLLNWLSTRPLCSDFF